MSEQWKPGIVHLRITPKKGERPFVSRHTCWNTDTFAESKRGEYGKEGGSVDVITAQEYEALR